MLREFTQPVGRFQTGEHRDYPQTTWDHLARSTGKKLDKFTKLVEGNPQPQEEELAQAGSSAPQ